MANIVDYLKWRGDISLKHSPFNEVDNLILAQLSYMDIPKFFNGMTINQAIDSFLKKYSDKEIAKKFPFNRDCVPFFKELQKSKRFKDIKIINYQNQISAIEEKQFCAMTFKLNFYSIYIAFRGTDTTLVGWKENLNMSFMSFTPSQLEAMKYVNRTSNLKYRNIYIGGHSKGGNLAVYAGVKCHNIIKKRIRAIYNNDGPGFLEDFVTGRDYQKMLPKIHSLFPETSIIGMLLFHKEVYKVIKSDTTLLWQHDPLSWQLLNTNFETLKEVDETSNKIRITISCWLSNIPNNQRELFVTTIYKILKTNKIETIEQLAHLKLRSIPALLKTFTKLDSDTKEMIMEILKELILEANKNFLSKNIFKELKLLSTKKHN